MLARNSSMHNSLALKSPPLIPWFQRHRQPHPRGCLPYIKPLELTPELPTHFARRGMSHRCKSSLCINDHLISKHKLCRHTVTYASSKLPLRWLPGLLTFLHQWNHDHFWTKTAPQIDLSHQYLAILVGHQHGKEHDVELFVQMTQKTLHRARSQL